jgi:hypothetical protein
MIRNTVHCTVRGGIVDEAGRPAGRAGDHNDIDT